MTVLWFEGEHPRKKRGRETTPSIRASKQARLPIPLEGRAGQGVGEEESRQKPEGVGTGGLLKGARGYLQWRADLHQASEMTESGLLKDSKGKSGERTLSLNHRNTESY